MIKKVNLFGYNSPVAIDFINDVKHQYKRDNVDNAVYLYTGEIRSREEFSDALFLLQVLESEDFYREISCLQFASTLSTVLSVVLKVSFTSEGKSFEYIASISKAGILEENLYVVDPNNGKISIEIKENSKSGLSVFSNENNNVILPHVISIYYDNRYSFGLNTPDLITRTSKTEAFRDICSDFCECYVQDKQYVQTLINTYLKAAEIQCISSTSGVYYEDITISNMSPEVHPADCINLVNGQSTLVPLSHKSVSSSPVSEMILTIMVIITAICKDHDTFIVLHNANILWSSNKLGVVFENNKTPLTVVGKDTESISTLNKLIEITNKILQQEGCSQAIQFVITLDTDDRVANNEVDLQKNIINA